MKIADLKEKHPAIYARALECQKEHGNQPNENLELADLKSEGGFNWLYTSEGTAFWDQINRENFQVFYERYPEHKPASQGTGTIHIGYDFPREMMVWDEDKNIAVKGLVIAFLPGRDHPFITVTTDTESYFNDGTGFDCYQWKNAEELPKVPTFTKAEIAEKLGLKVDEFEIK